MNRLLLRDRMSIMIVVLIRWIRYRDLFEILDYRTDHIVMVLVFIYLVQISIQLMGLK